MIPVILSGGSGTRLWPVSRKTHPKQFWPLVSEVSMLQETCNRTSDVAERDPVVICNEEHRFFVAQQLQEGGYRKPDILLEPVGRNTAPAAAVAALHLRSGEEDPVMLMLPADHVIEDLEAFQQAIGRGEVLAKQGYLVTFGILPKYPETGYGYIQGGAPPCRRTRKPSASTASWKNPTWPPPACTSSPATTSGTAACSCSAPPPISRSWRNRTLK